MKRLLCPLLAAMFVLVPCRRASAPVGIGLGLALKCIAIGAIIPTAIILYKCDQNFYLARYQSEGEDPWWASSKASAATLRKQDGMRCEGPWESDTEPKARAWANNLLPSNPPFRCGPLFTTINPDTNALRIVLEMSANGGASFSSLAAADVDITDNLSFVVFLTAAGTNGMTVDQLRQVADCDVAVTNAAAGPSALFRFAGRE